MGGISYGIASSTTYNIIHKSFHKCHTRAPVEGFAYLYTRYSMSFYKYLFKYNL